MKALISSGEPFKRVLVERQHTHIQTSNAKARNWCSASV